MTERSPSTPSLPAAATPSTTPLDVTEAKAQLLAWATRHEAAKQAARSKLGPILFASAAAAIGGLAISALVRSRNSEKSSAGTKARGLGARLVAFAAIGKVARSIVPHLASAVLRRLVNRVSAQSASRGTRS